MTDREAQRIADALQVIATELSKLSGVAERFAQLSQLSGEEREAFFEKERAQREEVAARMAAMQQAAPSNVVALQPQYLLGQGGIPIKI